MEKSETNEIIIYQPDETLRLDVQVGEDTVWLSQVQMVELFQTTKQNISLHINNIFKEGELNAISVVKDYLTTASDGKKYRTKYYNRLFNLRVMKSIAIILFASLFCSCGHMSNKYRECDDVTADSVPKDSINSATINLFGIETEKDEAAVVNNLAAAGILKIDSISLENDEFKFAIVEFAGVKFGLNHGFIFITSRHDSDTINALVQVISKYYGKPEIDDNGVPEYNYYSWNRLHQNPDVPYIRIRPLHSDERGLTMMWEL